MEASCQGRGAHSKAPSHVAPSSTGETTGLPAIFLHYLRRHIEELLTQAASTGGTNARREAVEDEEEEVEEMEGQEEEDPEEDDAQVEEPEEVRMMQTGGPRTSTSGPMSASRPLTFALVLEGLSSALLQLPQADRPGATAALLRAARLCGDQRVLYMDMLRAPLGIAPGQAAQGEDQHNLRAKWHSWYEKWWHCRPSFASEEKYKPGTNGILEQ